MIGNEYCALHGRSPDEAYDALFECYCDYVYAIVFNKLRSVDSREGIEECVSAGTEFSAWSTGSTGILPSTGRRIIFRTASAISRATAALRFRSAASGYSAASQRDL